MAASPSSGARGEPRSSSAPRSRRRRVAHGVQLHPLPAGSAPPRAPAAPPVRPQIDDGNVIEGEGHTVEIDVAELKTLIRAAEAKEAAAGDAAA